MVGLCMAGLACGLGMGGAALSPPLSPLPRAGAFPAKDLSQQEALQGPGRPVGATGRANFVRPVALTPHPGLWKAHWCDRSFAAAGARGAPAIHRERRHAPDRPQTLFGVPDGPFLLPSGTDDVISCAESMVSVPDELQEKFSLPYSGISPSPSIT